ncbi:MAG: class I SAM-dependent methyltransferase [Planctomycetota bacterium]|nr:class I SAM-dependent methyltransferase [Planctomycetota bacterium]
MSLLTDLKNIYHLTLKPVRGVDHAARMENFYAAQVDIYDDFRQRFLHGRAELYASLQAPAGGIWVDLGGGTGWCLEHCASPIGALDKVYVVDLSPSMLKMARQRAESHGWDNVETVLADLEGEMS